MHGKVRLALNLAGIKKKGLSLFPGWDGVSLFLGSSYDGKEFGVACLGVIGRHF